MDSFGRAEFSTRRSRIGGLFSVELTGSDTGQH